jgi:hypothetical protein
MQPKLTLAEKPASKMDHALNQALAEFHRAPTYFNALSLIRLRRKGEFLHSGYIELLSKSTGELAEEAFLSRVLSLLSSPSAGKYERLHRLWLGNALARYYCFAERSYIKSSESLSLLLPHTLELRPNYSHFEDWILSFWLQIWLNRIRLDFRFGKANEPDVLRFIAYLKNQELPPAHSDLDFVKLLRPCARAFGSYLSSEPRDFFLKAALALQSQKEK